MMRHPSSWSFQTYVPNSFSGSNSGVIKQLEYAKIAFTNRLCTLILQRKSKKLEEVLELWSSHAKRPLEETFLEQSTNLAKIFVRTSSKSLLTCIRSPGYQFFSNSSTLPKLQSTRNVGEELSSRPSSRCYFQLVSCKGCLQGLKSQCGSTLLLEHDRRGWRLPTCSCNFKNGRGLVSNPFYSQSTLMSANPD